MSKDVTIADAEDLRVIWEKEISAFAERFREINKFAKMDGLHAGFVEELTCRGIKLRRFGNFCSRKDGGDFVVWNEAEVDEVLSTLRNKLGEELALTKKGRTIHMNLVDPESFRVLRDKKSSLARQTVMEEVRAWRHAEIRMVLDLIKSNQISKNLKHEATELMDNMVVELRKLGNVK